jgi:hypothetical protein
MPSGPLQFAKHYENWQIQSRAQLEMGAVTVVGAVPANRRTYWNMPEPLPVGSSDVMLQVKVT